MTSSEAVSGARIPPQRRRAPPDRLGLRGRIGASAVVVRRGFRLAQRVPVADRALVNYNLDNGWLLITDMVITANWTADADNRWTVPLGGGIGWMFKRGNPPINSRLEAYCTVVRPDDAPALIRSVKESEAGVQTSLFFYRAGDV